MNNSEKLTLREAFSLTMRGYKLLWERSPGRYIAITAQAAFAAITPYVGIYITALLINEIAGARNPDQLRFYAIAALVSAAVLALVNAALTRWKNYESAGIWYETNSIYAGKLQNMNFSAVEDSKTYALLSHVEQNAGWNRFGLLRLDGMFENLVKSVAGILGAIALTVSLFTLRVPEDAGGVAVLNHPLVAIGVILLMLVVTFVGPMLYSKGMSYWTRETEEAKLGNRFFGAFLYHSADTRKAMDIRFYRQDKITYSYTHRSMNIFGIGGTIAKYCKGPAGALNAASTAVGQVFTIAIYVFVCLKAWGGAFGVGSVTQYIGAITALRSSITTLVSIVGEMHMNAVFLRTLFELLDIPDDMYQGTLTTEKRSDNKYEITFRDVSFRYPGSDNYVIKNLSLTFNIGQRLAVVGQNGSGKTTFIKLLCRLYDPTEGEILLNGIDIKKYNYQQYMGIFSAVFQDFKLLSFTLGQNVAAANDYDHDKALDCLTRAGFDQRLESLPNGLNTHLYKDLDKEGVEVSGGEAQKIAMARALYREAPFIVLDEPTAALDPVAEFEIYSKMNEIVGNKTAVFISHRLSSCRFCQDIAVFHEGELVQRGSHEGLVADENGKYHELWHAQAKYYN